MQDPFIEVVLDALGRDNCAFVGGAVRDSLLGLDVADIDVATSLRPEEVQSRLEMAGVQVVPTGLKHGTVTAVGQTISLEITTLRADVETDGRHAEVAFIDNWAEDAKRRDFTINAIFLKPDGRLFDPVGGLADLEARRVRFIGNPEKRIDEDALRILRFYRFSARYSDTTDARAHGACVEKRALLTDLSVERIRDEILKILAAQGVADVLRVMQAGDLFQEIFGPEVDAERLIELCHERADMMQAVQPLSKLWLMLRQSYDSTALTQKLSLSGVQKKHLSGLERCSDLMEQLYSHASQMQTKNVRYTCYNAGVQCAHDLTVFFSDGGTLPQHIRTVEMWDHPIFPVKGRDLQALGFKPGPEMGRSLKKLEQQWVASDFALDKDSLLRPL